ncbi:hypothetical protein PAXRUDRAFT_833678 [Paxillus rubicundulus Ve08.2h10]|uniref:Uncharacterized protein n=1 Tax=Paxillus rubicundulus Ve08.2h10 TaxID=930991 RepID=A0A0D0DNH3_9AGAM|nr:hypothetical protein PAXRUDRAFT_833678 [Paxillus rubicundulus Ve08.2h10]
MRDVPQYIQSFWHLIVQYTLKRKASPYWTVLMLPANCRFAARKLVSVAWTT